MSDTIPISVNSNTWTEVVSTGMGFLTNTSPHSGWITVAGSQPNAADEGHKLRPSDDFHYSLDAGQGVWVILNNGSGKIALTSGGNLAKSLSTIDNYMDAVSRGDIVGSAPNLLGGFNSDIGTTEEDLWIPGGTLIYVPSAETMNIASSSTDDDVGGIGATSLFVSGVLNGEAVTDVIQMDGTNAVETTQTFDVVEFMFLLASGSALTNIGTIIATSSVSGTSQCGMAPGVGISQHGFKRIPNGKSAIIKQVELNGTRESGGQSPIITFNIYARFSTSSPWISILDRGIDTAVQNQLVIPFPLSGVLVAGADLRMSARSSNNDTMASMRVTLLEYDA